MSVYSEIKVSVEYMFHSVIGPRPQANPAGLVSAQYLINYFCPKTTLVNGLHSILVCPLEGPYDIFVD